MYIWDAFQLIRYFGVASTEKNAFCESQVFGIMVTRDPELSLCAASAHGMSHSCLSGHCTHGFAGDAYDARRNKALCYGALVALRRSLDPFHDTSQPI